MDVILDQNQIDQIVPAGLDFVRAITETLGTDTGMALFNSITAEMPADVCGQIMFAMLTGNYQGGSVIIQSFNQLHVSQTWKIPAIKCVRAYTGLGLKDAKNVVDLVESGHPQKITLLKTDSMVNARLSFIREMRNLGFDAS
jgi:hypothetical protein